MQEGMSDHFEMKVSGQLTSDVTSDDGLHLDHLALANDHAPPFELISIFVQTSREALPCLIRLVSVSFFVPAC